MLEKYRQQEYKVTSGENTCHTLCHTQWGGGMSWSVCVWGGDGSNYREQQYKEASRENTGAYGGGDALGVGFTREHRIKFENQGARIHALETKLKALESSEALERKVLISLLALPVRKYKY
jgi:hypothetical protein